MKNLLSDCELNRGAQKKSDDACTNYYKQSRLDVQEGVM